MNKPMTCGAARTAMMERLFGESAPERDGALQRHLDGCPGCAREWDEARSAHEWYARRLADEPSASLDAALTQCARKTEPAARTGAWNGRTWAWAAAASFTVLIAGSSYFLDSYFLKKEMDIADSTALASVDMLPIDSRSASGEPEAPQAQVLSPRADARPMRTANGSAVIAAKADSADSSAAESIFRDGLRLYNLAFASGDGAKQRLLRQSLERLNGVNGDPPWNALASILIADAHNHLGEADEAIKTYRGMVRRHAGLEPYCMEARSSMISLMLGEGRLPEALRALEEFGERYPNSRAFAELAFAAAESVKDASPETALILYGKVRGENGGGHPVAGKASRLAAELEAELMERSSIRDWMLIGPMPIRNLPHNVPGLETRQYERRDRESMLETAGADVQWERPFEGETGPVDLGALYGAPDGQRCAFAATSVHSPESRAVNIAFKAADGVRIWVNGEPVWGAAHGMRYDDGWRAAPARLREGWNTVWIKSYHLGNGEEWKFAFRFLDEAGHFLTDLRTDPARGEPVRGQ